MIGSSFRERAFQASQSPLHLAPGAADHILAHRAFENRRKRATHAARVGPGKIGTRDQSFGLFRAPLVGPQRFALPLVRLAVLALDTGARHGDLGFSERARQRARTMTVPGADAWRGVSDTSGRLPPSIAGARQSCVQLLLHDRLDDAAHSLANCILDRIEPIVEKHGAGRDSRRLRGILRHGVVSFPALQRRNQLG